MLNNIVSKRSLLISAIPSLIVLIISIFFDSLYDKTISNFSGNAGSIVRPDLDIYNLWLYPVLVYLIFIGCLLWLIYVVTKKIELGNSSETEIIKTIEKWSGLVDGIGTALPLIGAAVILFTIGLGKENQKLFLEFAVPFEIKSLFILAIAKLFESVFDEFEIQVQHLYEKTNGVGEDLLIKDTKIEFVNLPDPALLKEINTTIESWNDTVKDMKDPAFAKNLEKILKITGKS